jgi:hypothetical protein
MNKKFIKWLRKQKYAHSYPMNAGWAIHKVAIHIRGQYTAEWDWFWLSKISKISYEKNRRLQ